VNTSVTNPVRCFLKKAATCSDEGASCDWGFINDKSYAYVANE